MRWQCRWVTQQDQDALLSLFHSAFGHAMPTNLWQWKYAWQDKYGVLAYVDDQIIAYYGGLPRSFWLQGKKIAAVQICDVMVAPEMRGILTRRGPFMQTANTFLAAQTGKDKPYRFAFGFPSTRAARLGEKSGWYARSDTFLEAAWPTTARLPFWFKARLLTQANNALIEQLWQSMQASLPNHLLPQKNADFFNWRYLSHPTHHYLSYLVSWRVSNKPVGVITLRDHGPDQGMELMDLLGSPDGFQVLLKTAQTVSRRLHRPRLFSWLTPAILAILPSPASQSEISGVYVTPDFKQTIEQLHARWWLMSGDTDFR